MTEVQTQPTGPSQPEEPRLPTGNGEDKRRRPRRSDRSRKKLEGNDRKEKTPPKFLELKKLVSRFKPITINGIPVSNIKGNLVEYIRKQSESQDDMYVSLLLPPSDPDFPFDLDVLKLSLSVPGAYPFKGSKPQVVVLNDEIPRGFSLNIEYGFREIVARAQENKQNKLMKKKSKKPVKVEGEKEGEKIEMVGGNDLTSMILTLDKYLDTFLAREKRETIKIVRQRKKKETPSEMPTPPPQLKRREEFSNPNIPEDIREARAKEIIKFTSRFKKAMLFKHTPQNTIYSLDVSFTEADFIVEIEGLQEFQIQTLPMRLYIPQEYLFNRKKGLRLEVALSHPDIARMVGNIDDKNLKMVFTRMLTNLSTNFQLVSAEFAKSNVPEEGEEPKDYWSISAQLNFFIAHVEKFLYEKSEFTKWNELRKQSNEEVTR